MRVGQRRQVLQPQYRPLTLYEALRRNNLLSGLKLCLDAGDPASYVSGQSWLDRSGNGHDFFLGADGSADAGDPTYSALTGERYINNYWSFDAGDYFTYDTTNETWMQNLHKDNAIFTLMAWVRLGSLAANQGLFGNSQAVATNIGTHWLVTTAGLQSIGIANGSGSFALNPGSTTVNPIGAWRCLGVSLTEGTGLTWFANGVTDTDPATYTSPSSSDATFTCQIGSRGNNNTPLTNGSRMGGFMAWEGVALSATQMNAFFNATRKVFGV